MTHPPNFGKNIQRLRKQRSLSLDMLADRSQVSKAMLSQIEQGKVNPTVGVIWKIAQGLNVQLQDLLVMERPAVRFEIKEKSNSTILHSDDGLVELQILSPPKMIESVELYLLHFKTGGALESLPHFPNTEEICTALEGQFEIRAGERTATIEPYQSVHYSADVPHAIRNASKSPAVAYLAVRYARG
jgi:transcriptional regulator with XRE-family HTH domain